MNKKEISEIKKQFTNRKKCGIMQSWKNVNKTKQYKNGGNPNGTYQIRKDGKEPCGAHVLH